MITLRRLLLCAVLTIWTLSYPYLVQAQALPAAEEKKTDKAQMLQIWKALMAYKEAKGKLPDFLSDLVPEYLPDKEVLISPTDNLEAREVANPFDDPKLRCSYMYAFSAAKIPDREETLREMMETLMEEFGPVVPILQRPSQGLARSVTYSGDYFESQPMWYSSPEAKELIKKLGIGPGLRNGVSTMLTIIDDGAAPVADAEVQLTGRHAEVPLPDRTLKTDAKGMVKIPLAPKGMNGHQVTVMVSKPGYSTMSEAWNGGDFQEERHITLFSATTIGGTVRLKDGDPLSDAEVLVKMRTGKPGEKNHEQTIAKMKTDAEGRWRCDSVPKNFEKLALVVKHTLVRSAEFDSSVEASPADRAALLAGTAELVIAPAPVLQGEVIGSDGKPLVDAEIFIRPLILKSIAQPENQMEIKVVNRDEAVHTPELPVKTNAKGNFSAPWSDEGKVLITVFANEHAPAQQIASGAGVDLLRFSLESGRAVSGTLSDYEGKPVSGAEVYLFMLGQNGLPVQRKVATTDSEGRFFWDHAPNRPLTLLFLCKGYSGALKDLRAGGPVETTVKIGRSSE